MQYIQVDNIGCCLFLAWLGFSHSPSWVVLDRLHRSSCFGYSAQFDQFGRVVSCLVFMVPCYEMVIWCPQARYHAWSRASPLASHAPSQLDPRALCMLNFTCSSHIFLLSQLWMNGSTYSGYPQPQLTSHFFLTSRYIYWRLMRSESAVTHDMNFDPTWDGLEVV